MAIGLMVYRGYYFRAFDLSGILQSGFWFIGEFVIGVLVYRGFGYRDFDLSGFCYRANGHRAFGYRPHGVLPFELRGNKKLFCHVFNTLSTRSNKICERGAIVMSVALA